MHTHTHTRTHTIKKEEGMLCIKVMIAIMSNVCLSPGHLAERVALLLSAVQGTGKVKEAFVQPRLSSRTSPH